MILIPAIDIRDGRAVRLRKGDFGRETVYAPDPLEAARRWTGQGARRLHVVDLDGARCGEPRSLEHLTRIAREVAVPVQYGGGLRTPDAVAAALRAGAQVAVVGTAALSDRGFLETVLDRFGDRVAVALDVRGGAVTVAGWTKRIAVGVDEQVERLTRSGVRRLVYTDADRDGTLAGPDLEGLSRAAAAAPDAALVYSGGVGSLEDLRALRGLGLTALEGVICGKALYERRFTVSDGQASLDDPAAIPR